MNTHADVAFAKLINRRQVNHYKVQRNLSLYEIKRGLLRLYGLDSMRTEGLRITCVLVFCLSMVQAEQRGNAWQALLRGLLNAPNGGISRHLGCLPEARLLDCIVSFERVKIYYRILL